MKDYHFFGRIGSDPIDVTLRTDALSIDTPNMTVHQIQIGRTFGKPTDNLQRGFDRNMAPFIGPSSGPTVSKTDMVAFAQANDLDLSCADTDGKNRVYLVDESSISNSASQF